ncbi:MAG: Holliday junction resolvase RuvX [Dokdonella sp.]
MPATPDGCILAFDYGSRLIGVAIGNPLSGSSRALTTLVNGERGPDWTRIDALVGEWMPVALVVGLPLALDGSDQDITRSARAFASALQSRQARPVHLCDERYSSQEAARRFAGRRAQGTARRKDAQSLDALAAAVILDNWLATQSSGG